MSQSLTSSLGAWIGRGPNRAMLQRVGPVNIWLGYRKSLPEGRRGVLLARDVFEYSMELRRKRCFPRHHDKRVLVQKTRLRGCGDGTSRVSIVLIASIPNNQYIILDELFPLLECGIEGTCTEEHRNCYEVPLVSNPLIG